MHTLATRRDYAYAIIIVALLSCVYRAYSVDESSDLSTRTKVEGGSPLSEQSIEDARTLLGYGYGTPKEKIIAIRRLAERADQDCLFAAAIGSTVDPGGRRDSVWRYVVACGIRALGSRRSLATEIAVCQWLDIDQRGAIPNPPLLFGVDFGIVRRDAWSPELSVVARSYLEQFYPTDLIRDATQARTSILNEYLKKVD